MIHTPLVPRITKSTAIAAIKARFNDNGELLERFEIAKEQANLWDGERDGLREAVKSITTGSYIAANTGSTIILTRTETAKVCYPNADGKHQLENCLQCAIPKPTGIEYDDQIIAFKVDGVNQPEEFLDLILHYLQKGKPEALAMLKERFIGAGGYVDNASLYEKKGSEKSTIAVIPNDK